MAQTSFWLPVVWACITALVVLLYVVLDGFDLGIGILFAAERNPVHRNIMVNTVAPVWDGNETWMVMGGATLYGVFPGAYSTILPALYVPIIAMVLALIFRGVAFEFRFKAHSAAGLRVWDASFLGGSLVATFCQGVILGGLIQGVRVTQGAFSGGVLDWLTPFSVACGCALVVGYALLGATWLVWRTEGALQATCRRLSGWLAVCMLLCIAGVSLWTPFLNEPYLRRWTVWPNIVLVSPVPVLVVVLAGLFWHANRRQHHQTPFLCALGWFFLCFSGLGITIWPYIVPPTLTIWDASSGPSSQLFLLAGTVVLIPLILFYTVYSYRVFRGKVTAAHHYH